MEKLLVIASLGQRVYGRWLFQRLLSGIVLVMGLAIVTSIMVSAGLIGGLYFAYFALLNSGSEPQVAMMILGIAAIIINLALIILTLMHIQHLRQMPQALLKQSPLASNAMDIVDAFSDGFITTGTK